MLSERDRIRGGLWGAVVGDALGVPVEFRSREDLRRDPLKDMRGYGTYNQPPGTWSDDSSLLLCTVESLLHGFDPQHLGRLFVSWLREAHWTPWGEVFDIGGTTRAAIHNLETGSEPEAAGIDDESSNGNGSLMRILPVALRFAGAPTEQLLFYAHRASSLTHRHPRSQMACGYYSVMAAALLRGAGPLAAYHWAIDMTRSRYSQPPYSGESIHFERLFSGRLGELAESEVQSSGYVIHTLEASVWCMLNSGSFEEAVLKAVNLGEDTDTTGTVTGGLAGVHFGLGGIPDPWVNQVARRQELQDLFDAFASPGLEDAIALAATVHLGQVDKGGRPYILHPLRVMLRLESELERMAAVLHDVAEDTAYGLHELRALGYPQKVLDALDCLTKRPGEGYEDFVARIKPNSLARKVKLADLEDNMDVTRLASISDRDMERLQRYLTAWQELKY